MRRHRSLLLFFLLAVVCANVSARSVWVVSSPLLGDMHSLVAIAERLEWPYQVVDLSECPSPEQECLVARAELEGWPTLVLHALNKPAEVEGLVGFKRLSAGRTLLVNWSDPGREQREFDLILAPTHLPPPAHGNVARIVGVPTPKLPQTKLEQFDALPSPLVGVSVGGSAKNSIFSTDHAQRLGNLLVGLSAEHSASLMITTSRRTPPEVVEVLRQSLSETPHYLYDWNSHQGCENPYSAILSCADYLVVTGDSMSMVCDATATGKPTYVFAPEGSLETRHKCLILELARLGAVRPLTNRLDNWSYTAPSAARQSAEAIEVVVARSGL